MWYGRPAKAQTSLRIRADLSSLLDILEKDDFILLIWRHMGQY